MMDGAIAVGDEEIPRAEHPRPQFRRSDDRWLCLNGTWEFEADPDDTGLARGLVSTPLPGKIAVPFCPESSLSGLGTGELLRCVWYRRHVAVPASWLQRRDRILLHFQAVDYDTTVWCSGVEVGRHRGGFTPFAFDVTDHVTGEDLVIVVRAWDDPETPSPKGKQSASSPPRLVHYARTTGIWQTVWLEAVPRTYFDRPRSTPDVHNRLVDVELGIQGDRVDDGLAVRAWLRDELGTVAEAVRPIAGDLRPVVRLTIPADRLRLWSPTDPYLYDVDLELLAGDVVVDRLSTYIGMRGVGRDSRGLLLNGEPLFQRLVLDQGYWPDGIMTAPDDAALVADITLAQAAGFNGARLHQKVFEERFLFHADRLGYLVWAEFPDWDAAASSEGLECTWVAQWLEAMDRDYSHPSVIGWCPLNERGGAGEPEDPDADAATLAMFLATKAADRTRPVIDTSGFVHRLARADVWDSHDYEQNPSLLAANHAGSAQGRPFVTSTPGLSPVPYGGQPVLVSEFGGAWWPADGDLSSFDVSRSWGHGRPDSRADLQARVEGQLLALSASPGISGYCYTQLTDVEQEQNGLYDAARRPKLDIDAIRAAQQPVSCPPPLT